MTWQERPGIVVRVIAGLMAVVLGIFPSWWIADLVGALRDDLYEEALIALLGALFLLGFVFGEKFIKMILGYFSLIGRPR